MKDRSDVKKKPPIKWVVFVFEYLFNYGCHLEYPNPIIIMLTTSMPLPRVIVLSLVARQVIKAPIPIIMVPSIAESL